MKDKEHSASVSPLLGRSEPADLRDHQPPEQEGVSNPTRTPPAAAPITAWHMTPAPHLRRAAPCSCTLTLITHACAVPFARRNTKLRKAESMVLYWDARVPFWNGKGSPADLAGQKVRESIKAMEEKARARYDALY